MHAHRPVSSLIEHLVYDEAARTLLVTFRAGRRYLYRPTVARGDYVAGESRRLIDRLFGGRLTPLVAHLAERDALSDQDINEIEALLKALKQ